MGVHMKIKSMFICEKCGKSFESLNECMEHEGECGAKEVNFICQCCGEKSEWHNGSLKTLPVKNSCHTIDLGVVGYGGVLEGNHVKFNICSNCLMSWFDVFEIIPSFLQEDGYMQKLSEAYAECGFGACDE